MTKKLLSLLLAGLLAAGLSLPAFASDNREHDEDWYNYEDDDRDDEDEDDELGDEEEIEELRSIRVSNSNIRLATGDGMQLTVRYSPTNSYEDVSWSSDHEEIATVSGDGYVTAVSEGRATIRVESENGRTATCRVEVVDADDPFYEVDEVEMNIPELTVRLGETRQLIAHVSPSNVSEEDAEIVWTTDDASIATVDRDGTVSGVTLGTTTITATAGDDESDTCRVTVVDAFEAIGDEGGAKTTASSSSKGTVVGSLTSASVRSNVESAAGVAAFADSGVITPELMTTAASAAGNKSVLLRFATSTSATPSSVKKRLGYMLLDPKVGRNLKNTIDTGVFVQGKEVDAASAIFDKQYKNETAALYLPQPGSFGMSVTIQAILDLEGMDTKNLAFYSYVDNKLTKLPVASYQVDANGFLHFPTSVGGIIIVSDGALVK